MKKYKVIKAIDIGNICYRPGIVAYGEMGIVKFLKENNLVDKYLEEVELSYKPFNPKKEEEEYFYVNSWGRVFSGTYYSDGNTYKWHDESGNCFQTKEEAEYHRDWLIARKRIMDSSDFVPDWGDINEAKWTIRYNYPYRILAAMPYNTLTSGEPVYYETRDQAEQAIKELENEYLVYFGAKRKLEEQ